MLVDSSIGDRPGTSGLSKQSNEQMRISSSHNILLLSDIIAVIRI